MFQRKWLFALIPIVFLVMVFLLVGPLSRPSAGSGALTVPTPLTPDPVLTPAQDLPPTSSTAASLRVTCNVPASVWLTDHWNGERIENTETCSAENPVEWNDLQRTTYDLHAFNYALDMEIQSKVTLYDTNNEKDVTFPGVLVIRPTPEDAEVDVDGTIYTGPTRVTFPAEQLPMTITVWVQALNYEPYGVHHVIQAGQLESQDIALDPLPTAIPAPSTAVPQPPVTAAPPPPTTAPFNEAERVELVRQKLYEGVNCLRAEGGMGPTTYLYEWQSLADEYARAWRDHYLAHGPDGFDDTPWRQQFQAAGGDAFPDNARLALYMPSYYVYSSDAHWETFDMCDPNCIMYGIFFERGLSSQNISGAVIGLAPWWNGDVLSAALVIGIKW